MKLSKLNNVVVRNSLYVLVFILSYTAILRYYNTEFFVEPVATSSSTNISQPPVEDKSTQPKPIIAVPNFKPYEPNQVSDTTASTEKPKEPSTPVKATQTPSTSTTTESPKSLFASFSSKFLLYIFASVLLVVLIVWGVINFRKTSEVPNSTVQPF